MSFLTISIYLMLAVATGLVSSQCPKEEDLAPSCICRDSMDGGMLHCSGMYSPSELFSPVQSCHGRKMFAISIHNSSLLYIPHDLFSDTNFEKIRLVNTELMSLSDTDDAFQGLENTLIEIRATEAHYVAQWRLSQLRKLQKLNLLDINWIQLESITEELPLLPELQAIGITHAGLCYVDDKVFANCPKLTILDLRHNEIMELKRTMLPSPANNLAIVNLKDNELESLPVNMFEAMPSLKELNLGNNHITVIDEKVFSDILDQLTFLFLHDNPIRCDCRMAWIVGSRLPYTFEANCAHPDALEGWKVKDVPRKHFYCLR